MVDDQESRARSDAPGLMKVLHVIGKMPYHGTQRQLVGMLRAAHSKLWDATLCVLRGPYPLTGEAQKAGIPVIELRIVRDLDFRPIFRLSELIRRGNFEVVHSTLWGCNLFTRLAVSYPRRPAMVIAERSVENWRPQWQRLIDWGLRRATDHYIGNSEDVADFIGRAHRVPSGRISVVRNGIDGSIFHARSEALPSSEARIGCLGRLIPSKGYDLAIEALPRVIEKHPARLLLAGDGEAREPLQRMAAGLPVEFLGEISDPRKVAEFLRSLHVFLMPSAYEGLPNALLEALACGVPVVGTDAPGMKEAIAGFGELVDRDPASLAEAIIRTLESGSDSPPRRPRTRSFEDVAADHLSVFNAARGRRVASEPAYL